jgi:hypothetical protein
LTDPNVKKAVDTSTTPVQVVKEKEEETTEELKGNQKKLDKNHNGKIDAQDFKILKGQKKKDVKEWVETLAENNYHSFTSKNEIMEMIQFKLQEAGPNVNIGHNGIPEFMTHDGDVETKPATPKVSPGTKPKPHNPNRASLEEMSFKFYQAGNCIDGGDGEELIVEAKSSMGIDGDGGAFFVLKTEQWAIDGVNEISEILKRVERAVEATNPTSIHTSL